MNAHNEQKGFSLLEITIVIVLLAITFGLTVLFAQTSQIRGDLNAQVSDFVAYLRLEQSSASSGLNGGESSGIHLEASSYTIFTGNVYDPDDINNFIIDLPDTIQIENINLNGDGSDIIFNSPNGETDNYGTFDFTSSQIQKTVTITVSEIGNINY